ncbi:hypothetical protein CCH79_00018963 [Gambusia affinis]|uniref:Reverse transcriptase domain-containing protein n=1 Tax=Gambusia affinis TaxID=33528 RepID=A0A315VH46_GAMAF|nr:hypothetical protein CCH79_00018963 [Gambusia affinis]
MSKGPLTERCTSQSVRIHNTVSFSIPLSTGLSQGWVLSLLLITLLTYDSLARHPSCHIVKFANNTAVVGRITNGDESIYREEVEHLVHWCRKNNLCINMKKTKEMVADFRREKYPHQPLYIEGAAVEVISSCSDLTWSTNTCRLVRKAHQCLCFTMKLQRAGIGSSVLTSFYRCVVESVLCTYITLWLSSCSIAERTALHRVVKAVQRTVESSLSSPSDLNTAQCRTHHQGLNPTWTQTFIHQSQRAAAESAELPAAHRGGRVAGRGAKFNCNQIRLGCREMKNV